MRQLFQEIRLHWASYLFMAPFMTVFFLFVVIPVVTAIYLGFTYFNLLEPPRWTGLLNYRLLFMEDEVFWTGLKNTVSFSVIAGPIGFVASFLLAWLINQLTMKVRLAYTLAFYSPSITSGIAMAVVWLYFFSPDRYGLINNLLLGGGFISEPVLWTLDVRTIMPVIIVISLWMSMGAGFLAFLAGLQNVDPQLYEAGAIDGVRTRLAEIWYITLPLMKPQLLFGSVIAVVGSFQVADLAMAVAGFPSPLYAGHTVVTHLYDYAFVRYEMGYASAVSVVLFVITFGLGRLLSRAFATRGDY